MGLYYEIWVSCFLKSNMPEQAVETLKYMTRDEDYEFDSPPNHWFFEMADADWKNILRNCRDDGDDYWSFPGPGYLIFRKEPRYGQGDRLVEAYVFNLRCFGKGSHLGILYIRHGFLPWLAQYSESDTFVGYWREEFTRDPTLIYFLDGKAYSREVGASEMQLMPREK